MDTLSIQGPQGYVRFFSLSILILADSEACRQVCVQGKSRRKMSPKLWICEDDQWT